MGVLRTILLALFTISFGALVAFGWDVSKGLVSAKTRGGIIPGIRASKTPLVILIQPMNNSETLHLFETLLTLSTQPTTARLRQSLKQSNKWGSRAQ
jgi:hypothetical protein